MAFTTDSLVRIAAAGGGIVMDCKGNTVDTLVRIAAATKQTGAKFVLTNTEGFNVDSLIRIGAAGAGNVIFDLRTT